MGFYNYIGGPNPRRGSKSASGLGPPGGPYSLADLDRGSKSASEFGPGRPNLGGSKSSRTPAKYDSDTISTIDRQRPQEIVYLTNKRVYLISTSVRPSLFQAFR